MARPRKFPITIREIAKGRGAAPWLVEAWGIDPVTGTYKAKNTYCESREAAEKFVADVQRHRARAAVHETAPAIAGTGVVTFNTHADEWLRDCAMLRKPSTYEAYELVLRCRVRPHLGHLPMVPGNFTVGAIKKFVATLAHGGLSWGSRKVTIRVLSSCLAYAVELERIHRNPCPGLVRSVKPDEAVDPEPNPLTRDQVWAFLEWLRTGVVPANYVPGPRTGAVDDPGKKRLRRRKVSDRDRACCLQWLPFFATLFYTGMRRGEAAGLKWEHVYLDGPDPRIEIMGAYNPAARRAAQTKLRRYPIDGVIKTKTGKTRVLRNLHPNLVALLRDVARVREAAAFKQRRDPFPFVFLGSQGNRLLTATVPDRWFHRGMEAIGATHQHHTVHDLRDTFATLILLRDAGKLLQVSAALGHADPAITLTRYTKVIDEGKLTAAAVAARAEFLVALDGPQDAAPAGVAAAGGGAPAAKRAPRGGGLRVVR